MDVLTVLGQALADRYRIEHDLGAGGMATVYLARDIKHNRYVALKVLRPELGAVLGTDRFLEEIRVTANLQHPHLLPLFDSGEADGLLYYVMPYVEGESLRARLERERQLPVEEAVRMASAVASALDYAHQHGVVHRDLKPENILLHAGEPMVADFGIALAVSNAGGARVTQTGISLGTPQYMSPEQATGDRGIDGRTDIYALGAILYELLAGEPPHAARTTQAVLARLLTERPRSVRVARPNVPAHVDAAITRALEKLPADRFATAREFADALQGRLVTTGWQTGAAVTTSRAWLSWRTVTVAGVAASVIAAASFSAGRRWSAPATPFPSEWEGQFLGGPLTAFEPRVSPNGEDVAFEAQVGNTTQVGVLKPASGAWTVLTSDTLQGFVSNISWSPDGSKVFFSRYHTLPGGVFSISALGGSERLVLEDAAGAEVLPDGSILVFRINDQRQSQIYRFWPETSRLVPLPAVRGVGGDIDRFFRAFPDGRELVFYGRPLADSAAAEHLYALQLESGRIRRLAPGLSIPDRGSRPLAVTPDGRWVLLVLPNGDLQRIVAVPRDGSDRMVTLYTLSGDRVLYLDATRDGSIYLDATTWPVEVIRYSPAEHRVLERQRIQANEVVLPLPDGRLLLQQQSAGKSRVMVLAPGKDATPFIDTAEPTQRPMALLGNDRVMLVIGSGSTRKIAVVSIATGRIERRLDLPEGLRSLAGSPDGRTIYFGARGMIYAMPAAGGQARTIRPGENVAVDPHGQYLVVLVSEQAATRLIRVALPSGEEREIPIRAGYRFGSEFLLPNAVGMDGRIVVRIGSARSWFWPVALLDPSTGALEVVPPGFEADMEGGWAADGTVVAGAFRIESRLLRLRPAPR